MATILLVRHGETDWNRDHRFQGHADPPLNDEGRRQARELAQSLAGDGATALFSSPLRRARETAEIVAAATRLSVEIDPRLMEVDVGSWSGRTRLEVEARFPKAYARWRAGGPGWEDGETYEQLAERVLAALLDIAARNRSGRIIVVGHGGTVRAVLAHTARLDLARDRNAVATIDNCSIHTLALRKGEFVRVD